MSLMFDHAEHSVNISLMICINYYIYLYAFETSLKSYHESPEIQIIIYSVLTNEFEAG